MVRAPEFVEKWCRRFEQVMGDRQTFDAHWSQVARRLWPEADQFSGSQYEPGSKRRQTVYSSHGSRALRKWVSVMMSQMVPKTEQWQQLRASNDDLNKDPAVKRFFEELTRRIFEIRNSPAADFYGTMIPTFSSLGAFGNGCFFMDDLTGGIVRYIPVPLQQVWIAVDQYKRVNTVFYKYPMSASAAQKKWGAVWGKNPPERVKRMLEDSPYKPMDWLHIVAPREDMDAKALGPKSMPWMSLHILYEDKHLVEERGYEEMPYIFSREMLEAHEDYGRGPGMVVLPELGTLDAMQKTFIRSGERVAAPPLLLHDDAFTLGSRVVNLLPDGTNFGAVSRDGKPLIQPLQTGARLDITREMMQDQEGAIDDAFGLNLFRILLEDPRANVTATEILQRAQEKGDLIAPSINARQSQMLGPETERLLGILDRTPGGVPEWPPALLEAEGEYRIEYSSPANRLQRSGEVAAITRTMEVIAPIAAVDPMVLRKFKGGSVVDRVMEIQGGPSDVLLTEDEFAQLQQVVAEQQQQAQAAAQAPDVARAMKDGAGALSELSAP